MFKSTKGVSKQRRSLINAELVQLRDLLPVSEATRKKLSQLQVMSLTCVYVRKCHYFQRLFHLSSAHADDTSCTLDFFQALSGFLLVMTRAGTLLYVSENVTDYLGHSMMDIVTQGDSVYDIVDRRDHVTVRSNLLSFRRSPQDGPSPSPSGPEADTTTGRSGRGEGASPGGRRSRPPDGGVLEERVFLCRMNVARGCRRQSGFSDHKMMHVRGHFVQASLGLTSAAPEDDQPDSTAADQPVFVAVCSPLVTPHDKERVVAHNTMIYHTLHRLDMSYVEISHNGEVHLGYTEAELIGRSWYELIHPLDLHMAAGKHLQLLKSSHEVGCSLTLHIQTRSSHWLWLNILMAVHQTAPSDASDDVITTPTIVCVNHVICESAVPPGGCEQDNRPRDMFVQSVASPCPPVITQPNVLAERMRGSTRHRGDTYVSPRRVRNNRKMSYLREAVDKPFDTASPLERYVTTDSYYQESVELYTASNEAVSSRQIMRYVPNELKAVEEPPHKTMNREQAHASRDLVNTGKGTDFWCDYSSLAHSAQESQAICAASHSTDCEYAAPHHQAIKLYNTRSDWDYEQQPIESAAAPSEANWYEIMSGNYARNWHASELSSDVMGDQYKTLLQ